MTPLDVRKESERRSRYEPFFVRLLYKNSSNSSALFVGSSFFETVWDGSSKIKAGAGSGALLNKPLVI
jgi:hypothetical protein